MKGNTTGFILLGLTLVSAVATAVLSLMTISAMNRQLYMQEQFHKVQQFRASTEALLNDAVIYGRKNPAILPLLEQSGFTPKPEALKQSDRQQKP